MIGTKLSPILVEIEQTLIDWEITSAIAPEFTPDGFRAATKIFMSALLDYMWRLQEGEKIDWSSREQMAQKAGEELRKLIHIYTDIDTFDFYK